MATFPLLKDDSSLDRMDAAHALLGVSPAVAPSTTRSKSSSSGVFAPRGSGLDALAALASKLDRGTIIASGSSSSSSDDDSDAMPPPPPRRRLRSCSNPEGMEKWDSLSRRQHERKHFVLPSSIIEEELAEAKAAAERKAEKDEQALATSLPLKKRESPVSVASPLGIAVDSEETEMDPEELLRRARSRLLEDLSEGSINGEKGVLTLPHSLSKYKEVYNKNGRIGIYTPAERAAIISRFNSKRSRRVWNKKIRYNCRKSLADRRMRVKGRFVKRSTEEMVRATPAKVTISQQLPPPPQPPEPADQDMPDVNDPEAGFAPTKDQPYRRLRRHTIT